MNPVKRLTVLITFFSLLSFISIIAVSNAAVSKKSHKEDVLNAYGKLPIYFVENKGQFEDKVKFYVKTFGQTLYFTDEGVVFDFVRPAKKPVSVTKPSEKSRDVRYERLVFNLSFENHQEGIVIEGLNRQEAKINYFAGRDKSQWKSDIPTYRGILYKGVYKGIDLKVFGKGRDIEYEFIVHPGGDPKDISLIYNGIEALDVNGRGELVISTAFGKMTDSRPYIYQEMNGKKVINGKFAVQESGDRANSGKFSYGFQVAAFDTSRPLIIDPTLSYATYLGGTSGDYGKGIVVDGSGNAYVTGMTYSTDFPIATQFAFQNVNAGDVDTFIAKFSSSGSALSYTTYLGGENIDYGEDIAVDSSGNAYVTGQTSSTDFPTENAYQGSLAGTYDAFIAKLSPSGDALSYATYLGGSVSDWCKGIAVDGSGSAYVIGTTNSSDFPTQTPYQAAHGGGPHDVFITKISPSGNSLSYSTYLGGENGDYGNAIDIDGSGNAYITGQTNSVGFPTENAYQGSFAGGYDAFVSKLSASGSSLMYSTYLGGDGNESGNRIAVDISGSAYVTGETISPDFPTENAYQGSLAESSVPFGSSDAFVTKLSPSGSTLVYSTYLGGSNHESGYGVAVDGSGSAYVTGITASSDFPVQNPYQATKAGESDEPDAFITRFSPSGISLFYSTYLGGSENDSGRDIALDASGDAYMVGQTRSSDFPVLNPYQAANAGDTDTFVAKLANIPLSLNIKANGSDGPVVVSEGTSITVQVSLDAGDMSGQNADWWLAIRTPLESPKDWYSYVYPVGWSAGISLCVQMPLVDLDSVGIPIPSGLPAGNYTFYFAIDDPDGTAAGPMWGLDSVKVTIN